MKNTRSLDLLFKWTHFASGKWGGNDQPDLGSIDWRIPNHRMNCSQLNDSGLIDYLHLQTFVSLPFIEVMKNETLFGYRLYEVMNLYL